MCYVARNACLTTHITCRPGNVTNGNDYPIKIFPVVHQVSLPKNDCFYHWAAGLIQSGGQEIFRVVMRIAT